MNQLDWSAATQELFRQQAKMSSQCKLYQPTNPNPNPLALSYRLEREQLLIYKLQNHLVKSFAPIADRPNTVQQFQKQCGAPRVASEH